jgi:hypothetical protein
MTGNLTRRESDILNGLEYGMTLAKSQRGENGPAWSHVRAFGDKWSAQDLLRHGLIHANTPVSGIHRTASSLVRKGLAERKKISGTVFYSATPAGRQLISPQPVPIEQAREEILADADRCPFDGIPNAGGEQDYRPAAEVMERSNDWAGRGFTRRNGETG